MNVCQNLKNVCQNKLLYFLYKIKLSLFKYKIILLNFIYKYIKFNCYFFSIYLYLLNKKDIEKCVVFMCKVSFIQISVVINIFLRYYLFSPRKITLTCLLLFMGTFIAMNATNYYQRKHGWPSLDTNFQALRLGNTPLVGELSIVLGVSEIAINII